MEKPVHASRRFRATWKTLDPRLRRQVIDIVLQLPQVMSSPHRHTGLSLRRLHGSDFWEARLDLRWRLILRVDAAEIVLFDVMNHDQVRRL